MPYQDQKRKRKGCEMQIEIFLKLTYPLLKLDKSLKPIAACTKELHCYRRLDVWFVIQDTEMVYHNTLLFFFFFFFLFFLEKHLCTDQ